MEGDILEQELHERFKASWSHSEWFKPTPDLMEFINNLPTTPDSGATQIVRAPWRVLRGEQGERQGNRAARSAV